MQLVTCCSDIVFFTCVIGANVLVKLLLSWCRHRRLCNLLRSILRSLLRPCLLLSRLLRLLSIRRLLPRPGSACRSALPSPRPACNELARQRPRRSTHDSGGRRGGLSSERPSRPLGSVGARLPLNVCLPMRSCLPVAPRRQYQRVPERPPFASTAVSGPSPEQPQACLVAVTAL